MRKLPLALRVHILLTIVLSFVATDTQAAADPTIDTAEIRGDTTVFPHRDVRVYFEVSNGGDEDSGEFWLRFYLSDDDDITEADDWRASRRVSTLPPGGTYADYRDVDLPSDIRRGDYYIGVMITTLDGTPVTTSTAGSITIVRPTDLRVAGVSADAVVPPGEQLDVSVAVENQGIGISDSLTIDCYLVDHLIGGGDFGPLDNGESDDFAVPCEIPSEIPEGEYFIRATVSCQHDEDSGNNEGESGYFWIGACLDLAVQSVRVISGAYALDDNLVVISHVKNISERDSESYTVNFYASTDTTISEDDHRIGRVERDALQSGQQDTFETTCRVPFNMMAGRYYIGIIITSRNEYGRANNVGHSTATVQVVSPSGYVYGHAEYQYSEYPPRMYPIRCALVHIFEADNNADPLDDRLLVQTHTDPNGNYGIILTDAKNSTPEIYIKILTEGVGGVWPNTTSKICVVKDEVFDETYSVVSEVYPHPGDESVVINLRTPGNGEFIVFDSVVEGFTKAKTFFDIELEQATVFWPSEDGFSYYDPCDSGIHLEQFDARDRDVIIHEYGHVVAEVCGVAQGQVGEYPAHYWNMDLRDYPVARGNAHAMNLAFRESWATLFSIATQYGDTDTGYPGAGDSRYDDGAGGSNLMVDLDNIGEEEYSPGKYFQNMNAGALWDIFDDKNDDPDGKDTISDPSLTMIWTISRDYKPEDILDFWNNWFEKYEYEQEMKYIFNTHNMWFAVPE